jgi:hypothetical protein
MLITRIFDKSGDLDQMVLLLREIHFGSLSWSLYQKLLVFTDLHALLDISHTSLHVVYF